MLARARAAAKPTTSIGAACVRHTQVEGCADFHRMMPTGVRMFASIDPINVNGN
jgi:hypothetical protein